MSSAGITFSGLGSGLDTQAIIQQLVQLERLPIQQIESKKQDQERKLDTLEQLKTLLKKLQEKAETLGDEDSFFTFSSSMSHSSLASISASGNAVAGSHSIEVQSTAVTDRWAFDGVTDPDTDLAGAVGETLSFTVNGSNYSITIDDTAASSLTEIASAINTEAPDDVEASIVQAGTEANPSYQLVLTSKSSGEDYAITSLTTDISGLNATATNVTVAENAVAVIDGITIERSDNDFSGIIDGVSIDLLAAELGTEATFTIEADKDEIKGRIQDFISGYNEVITFINRQSSYSEDTGTGGRLFGDSILTTVRSTITNAIFNVDSDTVANDTEGYSTLSLVGIVQNTDGSLRINESTFDDKVTENLSAFADLFIDYDGFDNGDAERNTPDYFIDTTADSGLAATLDRALDRLFKSQDGPINQTTGERDIIRSLFDTKKATINSAIKRFDRQIEDKERRIESYRENLVKRFTNLEQVMAQLNSQSSYLNF